MTTIGMWLLMGTLALPLLSVGAMTVPRVRRTAAARVSAALHWGGAALALALVGVVAVHGTVTVGVDSSRGVLVGLTANRLTVVLILLVASIGAVVQSFSARYLRSDPRAVRFVAGSGALVASMIVVAASTTMAGLVAGWVIASASFLVIVGYRPDLPGVRSSARRTAVAFLVGDGALVVAALLVARQAGNVALVGSTVDPLTHVADRLGAAGSVVALLIVVAALARSAQGPFGVWLPGTVAAPTPVSALLHAGFVNGGGILLIRTGAIASDSVIAMVVAFTAAAATAVAATAVMAQRTDVKSELAYSTMGQMGFMVAECAVGAFGAGLIHLVGHALYKATLFLGSGGQMSRPGRVAPDSDQVPTLGRAATAATAALASFGAVLATSGLTGHRASGPLALFVAATAGVSAWSLGSRHHPGRAVFGVGLIVVASVLYGFVAATLFAWISPDLPRAGSAVLTPWLLLAVAAGGVSTAALLRAPVLGLRIRIALIDLGAPSAVSTQRTPTLRPALVHDLWPGVDVTPVRQAA